MAPLGRTSHPVPGQILPTVLAPARPFLASWLHDDSGGGGRHKLYVALQDEVSPRITAPAALRAGRWSDAKEGGFSVTPDLVALPRRRPHATNIAKKHVRIQIFGSTPAQLTQ